MSMFTIGTRIRNKHTAAEYTICDIIVMDFGLLVYEVSNDEFNTSRFNQDYLNNYEVIS
jgi:hypothetical protein